MNIHSYKPMLQANGALVGRILIALLFVSSGANMLLGGVGNSAAYFDSLGLPIPMLLAIIVIAVKIVGGLCVMAGYKTEEAAFALLVFTVLATLVAHMDTADMSLWKNLSIIGGLLYVIAYGPGNGWQLGLGASSREPAMDDGQGM